MVSLAFECMGVEAATGIEDLPNHESLRRDILKLDYMFMAWERHQIVNMPRHQRVCRFLIVDASPQCHYDYFAMQIDEVSGA